MPHWCLPRQDGWWLISYLPRAQILGDTGRNRGGLHFSSLLPALFRGHLAQLLHPCPWACWEVLAPGWVVETQLSAAPWVSRLTCQDGIQLCYHVSCVVQAETHRGLELQDIPSGAVGAQQNVVFFQPARIGHSRACCPPAKGTSHGPFRPSSAWLWPRGRDSSHTALRTFHRPVPTRIQHWPPPAKLLPNFMAQHQRPLSGVPYIWP